jgi:hypothetical protein
MNTATIFYINDQLLARQDAPFGVRYGSQILPRDSVVVGFLVWDGSQVQELLDSDLFVSPNQEANFNECLGEARAVLQ